MSHVDSNLKTSLTNLNGSNLTNGEKTNQKDVTPNKENIKPVANTKNCKINKEESTLPTSVKIDSATKNKDVDNVRRDGSFESTKTDEDIRLLFEDDRSMSEEADSDGHNSFVDSQAEEGDEDTPSDDSNDIIEVGEAINSTDSEYSIGSYEDDSFIEDESESGLLTGSGDDLSIGEQATDSGRKHRRIIELDSDDDNVKAPTDRKKWEKVCVKRKKSRIIKMIDSSDEEVEIVDENEAKSTEMEAVGDNLSSSLNDSRELSAFEVYSNLKMKSPVLGKKKKRKRKKKKNVIENGVGNDKVKEGGEFLGKLEQSLSSEVESVGNGAVRKKIKTKKVKRLPKKEVLTSPEVTQVKKVAKKKRQGKSLKKETVLLATTTDACLTTSTNHKVVIKPKNVVEVLQTCEQLKTKRKRKRIKRKKKETVLPTTITDDDSLNTSTNAELVNNPLNVMQQLQKETKRRKRLRRQANKRRRKSEEDEIDLPPVKKQKIEQGDGSLKKKLVVKSLNGWDISLIKENPILFGSLVQLKSKTRGNINKKKKLFKKRI